MLRKKLVLLVIFLVVFAGFVFYKIHNSPADNKANQSTKAFIEKRLDQIANGAYAGAFSRKAMVETSEFFVKKYFFKKEEESPPQFFEVKIYKGERRNEEIIRCDNSSEEV